MAKARTIFMATCDYGNYTLTALGSTEKEAKDAVLKSLEGPAREAGHESAEAMWEYMSGGVSPMKLGECEWL
jgi:hypothetical protein